MKLHNGCGKAVFSLYLLSVPMVALGAVSLFEAAQQGDTSSLVKVLREGEKIDAQDKRGMTALMHAARHQHLAAVHDRDVARRFVPGPPIGACGALVVAAEDVRFEQPLGAGAGGVPCCHARLCGGARHGRVPIMQATPTDGAAAMRHRERACTPHSI